MHCNVCGREFEGGTNFCPFCAAPLNEEFQQNYQNQNQQWGAQPNGAPNYGNQPPYGAPPQQTYAGGQYYGQQPINPNDKPSAGLNFVAFFVPLVGLILYILWKDETPVKAKAIGKWALIGVVVSVVFSIIVGILTFIFSFTMMSDMMYYSF